MAQKTDVNVIRRRPCNCEKALDGKRNIGERRSRWKDQEMHKKGNSGEIKSDKSGEMIYKGAKMAYKGKSCIYTEGEIYSDGKRMHGQRNARG